MFQGLLLFLLWDDDDDADINGIKKQTVDGCNNMQFTQSKGLVKKSFQELSFCFYWTAVNIVDVNIKSCFTSRILMLGSLFMNADYHLDNKFTWKFQ